MLQQTRVETVIEYFRRWMEHFPTVQALAQASLEDVNRIWAGLGYYRRAKLLHSGAQMVVDKLSGQLPKSVSGLLTVPGIGVYTAGVSGTACQLNPHENVLACLQAIASIAYGLPVPAVDGNVIRVFSRLRAVAMDPAHRLGLKVIQSCAQQTVSPSRAGHFNQALMELGTARQLLVSRPFIAWLFRCRGHDLPAKETQV